LAAGIGGTRGEQDLSQAYSATVLDRQDQLASGDLQEEPGLGAAGGLGRTQRGRGCGHLRAGRQDEPDRVAGVFYRRRGGGDLPPLADPGGQSTVVQRAALGPGPRGGLLGGQVKAGLAVASRAALFRARVVRRQPAKNGLELAFERAQLGLLLVDLADPTNQIRPQAGLQGPALARWPRRNQVGDVLKVHPDALGPLDEGQLIQRGLIEQPIPVACPAGR
jgi:hypothetical protein